MNFINKIIFFIVFYFFTVFFAIFSLPLLFLPRKYLSVSLKLWSKFLSTLLYFFFKIEYKIFGEFKYKQVIYSIQHQSVWETIVLADQLPGSMAIIMKKELISLPIIGWLFRHSGAIPLNRGRHIQSMRRLLLGSENAIKKGDSIIIYPQGTRVMPGVKKPYLPGVYAIYKHLNIPVVPIALNSGKFWYKFYLNGPGEIKVTILPAILPGMGKIEFMSKLENLIENEAKKLLN